LGAVPEGALATARAGVALRPPRVDLAPALRVLGRLGIVAIYVFLLAPIVIVVLASFNRRTAPRSRPRRSRCVGIAISWPTTTSSRRSSSACGSA